MTGNQTSLNINNDPISKLQALSRDQLIKLAQFYADANAKLAAENRKLLSDRGISEQFILKLQEQRLLLRNEIFGSSSEKSSDELDAVGEDAKSSTSSSAGEDKSKKLKVQKPSKRWPGLTTISQTVTFEAVPSCDACKNPMEKINAFEESEFVEVITRSFYINKQRRQKYKCSCCEDGGITTTPVIPRITPGGSYSDRFAIEVATQKYCSHVPIHRIVNEMRNQGLIGIDSRTLIEQTHNLAEFLREVYRSLKEEVRLSLLLYADETRWRQMEDEEKRKWYLWGFFTLTSAFYKAHPSRSKECANDVLKKSNARYLMVDGYTGYHKPSKDQGILIVNCWAHVRRRFHRAELAGHQSASQFLKLIRLIYDLDREAAGDLELKAGLRKTKGLEILRELRQLASATERLPDLELDRAIKYMEKYWMGLTRFVHDPLIPLDNNLSERAIRGPVVGRKNYYGNHSEKGAETSAILLSISESAKMNGLDPRKYMLWAVHQKHQGLPALTPAQVVLQKINLDNSVASLSHVAE